MNVAAWKSNGNGKMWEDHPALVDKGKQNYLAPYGRNETGPALLAFAQTVNNSSDPFFLLTLFPA